MLSRSSARAPALLRAAAPRLAAATSARGLAGPSTDAPPAPVPEEFLKGRTPERYAELEKLAEEHNGFLFGEVPLPEGQSRQWQDWEYSYTPLMLSAFAIYGIAYYYR